MNKTLLVVVALVGGAVAFGCSKGTDSYVQINYDKIKKDKEAFQMKAEASLKDFDERIAELKAKAKDASAEAKIKLDEAIKELEPKKEAARQKLADIKAASLEKWELMKPHMQTALDDLKSGFEKAFSRFK
jgi:hypothetical protein